jgi:hypothetical protein
MRSELSQKSFLSGMDTYLKQASRSGQSGFLQMFGISGCTRMTKIAKVHTSVVLISKTKASHSELSVIPCRKRMPYVSMH